MNATMWICRIALAVLLIVVIRDTFAHHSSNHREVYVGEASSIPIRLGICLEKTDMEAVYEAGKRSKETFYATFFALRDFGKCGVTQMKTKVLEVYDTHTNGDTLLTLVRLAVLRGDKESGEAYSVILNIKVVALEDKCVNCVAM